MIRYEPTKFLNIFLILLSKFIEKKLSFFFCSKTMSGDEDSTALKEWKDLETIKTFDGKWKLMSFLECSILNKFIEIHNNE